MTTRVRQLLSEVSDPSTKAAYSELCFKHARDAAQKATKIAPFAVSDAEATTLERMGITTSPFATTSHTHSADKILENDCLQIIGYHLPKEPVTFIQLKKGKLHLLNRAPKVDYLANYCHEPKDVLRYGITHPGSCPSVSTEYAVLADTLHFMSTRQLIELFTGNPNLQRLFATLVLPVEALHRLPSLFPEVYKLEYYQNHFAYLPGGHGGGAYVHSYATLKWLSTGQVGTHTNDYISTGQCDYLTIEKIETKAAHHIMFIQRRRLGVEWPLSPLWVFHASDYVRLHPVFYPPEANVQNSYPHNLIMRLQAYCFSVKAVSLRDIFAKIRQVIPTEDLQRYSMADLIRLANYLLLTTGMQQTSSYDSLLTSGIFGQISARIKYRVHAILERLTGKTSYEALLSVADVIPVRFTTTPKRRPATGARWFEELEEGPPEDPSCEQKQTSLCLEDLDLVAEITSQPQEAGSSASKVSTPTPDPTKNPTREGTLNANPGWSRPEAASPPVERCGSVEDFAAEVEELEKLLYQRDLVEGHPNVPPAESPHEAPAPSSTTAALPSAPFHSPYAEKVLNAQGYVDGRGLGKDLQGSTAIPTTIANYDRAGLGYQTDALSLGAKNPDEVENLKAANSRPTVEDSAEPPITAHNPTEKAREERNQHSTRTKEILMIHGFTNLQLQYDQWGVIQPVHWNEAVHRKTASKTLPPEAVQLKALAAKLKRSFYQYQIDRRRANAYMSDVKNSLTGLVLPKLDRDLLRAWVGLTENSDRKVHLLVIHGAGGAGKSRALQELLRGDVELQDNANVIVPTVNLVADWKTKMNQMDAKRFMTFEKACEREGRTITIFDDYGKLPPGYIDAYLAIKPTVEVVVLTGDQRQSVYHISNQDAQTATLSSNIKHFSPYCDYYINATHRQPRRLANPISVHAERELGGAVHRSTLVDKSATVLVPAHRTQSTFIDLGQRALTYSGCQGLTLPHITIVLNNDTPLCSNEVLYTAFSRASESITFVNTHSDNADFLAKLDGTPYLKTLLSGVREDEQAGKGGDALEVKAPEPTIKTHFPVENTAIFLEDKIESVQDKDVRELWGQDEKTNLMQTQDQVVQLFPHQQAKDEALFKITIDKRIRQANPRENMASLINTGGAGDLLFEAYARFMKVPEQPLPFNQELWLQSKQKALRTFVSKPLSNLVQGATRQDPDFPDNAIALFNKSQWVKKLEKVGFPFKAGQTISAFKQSTVLLTTTMALYLRAIRDQHQPDNVFIMCEKTPEAFNDFVVNRWSFEQPSYTSDYEQYDQSQDGAFLNFELRKARHLGVPEEVIQFYRFIKLHARTFVGNLAIMRLSGEGPTFDANTECNIAYDALRFQLDDKVNACYAGDDLARDRACPERPSWKYVQQLFSLKAKPVSTVRPDFCGWRITQYGILKSPTQLRQSLELAIRLGKIEEVRRSYAIDYAYAYRLQDKLFEVLTEQEMCDHQAVTRVLVKRGVKMPDIGEHLPTFHITSDRLIQNPHYKEMHDSTSDRLYLVAPVITEDHFK